MVLVKEEGKHDLDCSVTNSITVEASDVHDAVAWDGEDGESVDEYLS